MTARLRGILKQGPHVPRKTSDEMVDEASMDSFPASDPPSYWARHSDEERKPRPRAPQADKEPDTPK